jgi:hypothetical protein
VFAGGDVHVDEGGGCGMLVDVGVGAAEEVGKVFDEIADADF